MSASQARCSPQSRPRLAGDSVHLIRQQPRVEVSACAPRVPAAGSQLAAPAALAPLARRSLLFVVSPLTGRRAAPARTAPRGRRCRPETRPASRATRASARATLRSGGARSLGLACLFPPWPAPHCPALQCRLHQGTVSRRAIYKRRCAAAATHLPPACQARRHTAARAHSLPLASVWLKQPYRRLTHTAAGRTPQRVPTEDTREETPPQADRGHACHPANHDPTGHFDNCEE